jgi:hypothetical protein
VTCRDQIFSDGQSINFELKTNVSEISSGSIIMVDVNTEKVDRPKRFYHIYLPGKLIYFVTVFLSQIKSVHITSIYFSNIHLTLSSHLPKPMKDKQFYKDITQNFFDSKLVRALKVDRN